MASKVPPFLQQKQSWRVRWNISALRLVPRCRKGFVLPSVLGM